MRLALRGIRTPAYCRNRTCFMAPGGYSLLAMREGYRAVCLLVFPVASSTASAGRAFLVLSSLDRLASRARSLDGVLTGGVAMPKYFWRVTAHISRFWREHSMRARHCQTRSPRIPLLSRLNVRAQCVASPIARFAPNGWPDRSRGIALPAPARINRCGPRPTKNARMPGAFPHEHGARWARISSSPYVTSLAHAPLLKPVSPGRRLRWPGMQSTMFPLLPASLGLAQAIQPLQLHFQLALPCPKLHESRPKKSGIRCLRQRPLLH